MAKKKNSAEATVRNIRRNTRKKYSPEDKIRIVVEGLRGEQTIAELCRKEGIAQCEHVTGIPPALIPNKKSANTASNWLNREGWHNAAPFYFKAQTHFKN